MGLKLPDYHIHTKLCHHAVGEISDYVIKAEAMGLLHIGFSDHAPIPMPKRLGITMEPRELPLYIEMIKNIASKSKIPIKLGLEIDFPIQDTLDIKLIEKSEFDYLIGSVHFIGEFGFDQEKYLNEWKQADIDKIYRDYYTLVIEAANTGLFTTIGHLDLVKKFGFYPKEYPLDLLDDLIKIMKKKGIVYELNTSGKYKPIGKFYPDKFIIERMFKNKIDVTLGSDAHAPNQVGRDFKVAVSILKNIGYKKIAIFSKMKKDYINI